MKKNGKNYFLRKDGWMKEWIDGWMEEWIINGWIDE